MSVQARWQPLTVKQDHKGPQKRQCAVDFGFSEGLQWGAVAIE